MTAYNKMPPAQAEGISREIGQGRNRTADTGIFSPLLYRLSYLTTKTETHIMNSHEKSITNPKEFEKKKVTPREISIFRTWLLIILIFITGALRSAPDWRYYYKKGLIEYREHLYEFALENLNKALERKPDLYDAANIIAHIYMQKGDRFTAEKYLLQSLSINEMQGDIHYQLGVLYDYTGQYDKALSHFLRAVEIDPSHRDAHLNLIKQYWAKGDSVNAEKHFAICYRIGKSEGLKLYREGLQQEEQKNDREALALYQRSLKACPVLTEAYFRIAEIHRRSGNITAAIRALEEIKKIRPDNDKVYIYIAHLLFTRVKAKNRSAILQRAIDNLHKAIEVNPKNSEPYFLLSEIYLFIGKREKAVEYNRKAAALEESEQ
jgi:tetratricopeptide (TPR) repeat protein